MILKELAGKLGITQKNKTDISSIDIPIGYIGDLLSDVLAHAQSGSLWITIQKHKNILAVATAKDLAAIVIVNGIEPEESLLSSADTMDIPVFVTPESSFVIAGKLYSILGC